MFALTSSFVALLLTATSGVALAQGAGAEMPPSSATVTSSSWSGNGCPQGTVEFLPGNPDGTLDTGYVVLRRYFTAIGSGTGPTDRTRNCQAHINVNDIPAGWQFAVKNVKVKGYYDIQNATLTVFATAYFSQNPRDTMTRQVAHQLQGSGPLNMDILFDDAGPWSPCGSTGILNVNFRTSFTSPNSNARGYFGPGDGVPYVTEKIEYQWRRC